MSKLLEHTFLFSLATLISRILGLVRDASFAHYFGISAQYDAYSIAILFPFFLRKIFADGALSSAFVPLFNRKDGKDAQKFFSTTFWSILIVTSLLYIPVGIFSDKIVLILGTGLPPSILDLTSFLLKISYPYIIFISLWAVITGVLNSKDIYFGPAVAPALSNIVSIIFIVTSSYFIPQILGPTIGFTIGGVVEFLLVFFILKKIRFPITFDFNVQDLKPILKLFGPALLGVAVGTLNTLIDTNIATWTGTGGVSTIEYALRIYQLPLGIFAVSVANALLPKLSYSSSMKNDKEFQQTLENSIELMLFFIIPATFGLIFLNKEIIALIYQHGNFTYQDTLITSKTLLCYSLGLPFYALHTIFIRKYHSQLNTKYPSIVAVIMLLINAFLDIILAKKIGVPGIALATSISGFFGMLLTGFSTFKSLKIENWIEIIKIFGASLIMAFFIIIFKTFFYSRLWTILIVTFGALIYVITSYLLGYRKLSTAINLIFKRKNRK
ncbi:MAG: murein biosynthesis integral membrane protein MurJ [Defluviitoga tunisiensis]|nr:murein biosynthesis integral membrane protein MurJ [Defluviitoga tunisiensis]